MVTPTSTPRLKDSTPDVWIDDVGPSLPRPLTAVKFQAERTFANSAADFSAVDMLSSSTDPWITGVLKQTSSTVRKVIPLPTTLSRSTTRTFVDTQNYSVSFVPEDHPKSIATHVEKSTFSAAQRLRKRSVSQDRTAPSRGRIRPHSASRGSLRSGFHVPDAQCCGFQHREEHAAHSKVFVTFCESTLHEKVEEAQSALQKERDLREHDAHHHEQQVVKLLRQLKELEEERDGLRKTHASLQNEHDRTIRESSIIRNEYERRWRESEVAKNANFSELQQLRDLKAKSEVEADVRRHAEELLKQQLSDVKLSLELVQKESAENVNRAQTYFEELSIARKSIAALEKELATAREVIAGRDAVIRGFEKELNAANEKLSSIAVLRSTFRPKGSAKH